MTLCTRSVCLASSGRLAEERGVCCGAGERDEPVSNTQPVVVIPASIKTAIVRRILIASLSSDHLSNRSTSAPLGAGVVLDLKSNLTREGLPSTIRQV